MISRRLALGSLSAATAQRHWGDRFLYGRGVALSLAPDHGFSVTSVNYGTAPDRRLRVELLGTACPIVVSYGGKDL
jgi:hypothetical protein